MGLLVKKLTMPFGVEFSDVYFKINRLSYNDEDGKLYFAGAFYVNQAAREDGLQPLENGILCEVVDLPDKTVNLYEFIYNYIKTKAIEVYNMTPMEITEHNNAVEIERQTDENARFNLINPNYALFYESIDC